MNSEPATKEDVREIVREAIEEFAIMTKLGFDAADKKIDRVEGGLQEFREYVEKLEQSVEQQNKELREYIDKTAQETRDHFDAVAENIHRDVAGANRSEIELIQTKQDSHEGRIVRLEQKTGVR